MDHGDSFTRARTGRIVRGALIGLVLAVFAARAIDTARVYNHTVDEPTQIASGLEMLQFGTFELHNDVPPLAKVLLAAPLYLAGVRLEHPPGRSDLTTGPTLLYQRTDYWSALRTARAVATVAGLAVLMLVWYLASRALGAWPGVLVMASVSISPALVSAASIANSDMIGLFFLLLTLHAFRRLVAEGGALRAGAFAAAIAAAVLSRLSAPPFLLFCLPVIVVFECGRGALGKLRHPLSFSRDHLAEISIVLFLPLLLAWAAYGFRFAPLTGPVQAQALADALAVKHPSLAQPLLALLERPIPLGGFLRAFGAASAIGARGYPGYWAGRFMLRGPPFFFVASTLLKVPLGLLIGALAAAVLSFQSRAETIGREVLLWLALGVAVLIAVSIFAPRAGHRYALPWEVAICAAAGASIVLATRSDARMRTWLVAGLALCATWAAASSLACHPDALGYFNALAGREPDRWLIDSNVDWGQDLERLRRWLREHHVEEPIHLAYFGTADPARHGINFIPLAPGEKPPGWIAISVNTQRGLGGGGYGQLPPEPLRSGYLWSLQYTPVATIGTSIRVYQFDSAGAPVPRSP